MAKTFTTSLAVDETLLQQAEALAAQLNLSPEQLLARALEHFVQHSQRTPSLAGSKAVNQGDIYWVRLEPTSALDMGIPHPYVVIQDNLLNHSRIHTAVVCALTSNIRRVSETPGNILLDVGEANLPKQSVVEVSKVSTVDKAQLGEQIGTLTPPRVNQILAGMRFLQQTYFAR